MSLSHANGIQGGKKAACFEHFNLFKVNFSFVGVFGNAAPPLSVETQGDGERPPGF